MRNYINKLQAKHEDSRRAILTGSLVVSMVIVSAIWISSFKEKFNLENQAQARNDIKPFTLFSNSISSAWDNVSASVGKISFSKDTTPKQINVVPVNATN